MNEDKKNSNSTDPTQPLEPGQDPDDVQELDQSQADPFREGDEVGGYRIQERIGSGGMSVVYRAYDESLDRDVALKILPRSLETDEKARERFIREARSAASLSHPNIVQVYSAGEENGIAYMAMEYIEGHTLGEIIKKKTVIETDQAVRIVLDIAEALKNAHASGIIHRDIKPSNILIAQQGEVKVADFGLSRGITSNTRITQTGTYLGTPAYSSPEQCESKDLDDRSDIYSLGAVFYEMLTGEIPHDADTPLSMMKKIIEEKPRPVRELNGDVPEKVLQVVHRMLATDRQNRYQSMDRVIKDLNNVLEGKEVQPTVASGSGQKGEGFSMNNLLKSPSMKTLGMLTVPALLLLIGFLIVPYFLPESRENTGTANSPSDSPENSRELPMEEGPMTYTVAALDFVNGTRTESRAWMKIGIPDLLISQLSQLEDIRMLTRSEMIESVRSNSREFDSIRPGSNEDEGKTPRLTNSPRVRSSLKKLGTEFILTGRYYLPSSNKLLINVKIFKLTRTEESPLRSYGTVKVQGKTENLFSLVDELAKKVVSRLFESNTSGVASKERKKNLVFQKTSEETFARDIPVHIKTTYNMEDEEDEIEEKSINSASGEKKSRTGKEDIAPRKVVERESDRGNRLKKAELPEKAKHATSPKQLKSVLVRHFQKNLNKKDKARLFKKFCEARQAHENGNHEKLQKIRTEMLKMMVKNTKVRKRIEFKLKTMNQKQKDREESKQD